MEISFWSFVEIVNLLEGWSVDCDLCVRCFTPYVFQRVLSLGAGFVVGLCVVEVASLLDGVEL